MFLQALKVQAEKGKRKKIAAVTEDDSSLDCEIVGEEKQRKRRKKHQDPRKIFNAATPWKSSSESSESEEEEIEEEVEQSEEEKLGELKSDHEFSPESDLEEDGEAQPLKRARTARKGI